MTTLFLTEFQTDPVDQVSNDKLRDYVNIQVVCDAVDVIVDGIKREAGKNFYSLGFSKDNTHRNASYPSSHYKSHHVLLSHKAENANWNDPVWQMIEILAIYRASFDTPTKCIVQTEGGDSFSKGEMTAKSGIYIQIGDESKSANELFEAKNNGIRHANSTPTKQPPKTSATSVKTSTHGYRLARNWDETIDWDKTFPLLQVLNDCNLRLQRNPEFDYGYSCDCGKAASTEKAIRDHVYKGNAQRYTCHLCSFQTHIRERLTGHMEIHNKGKRKMVEKIADIVAAGSRKLKKFK
jgi:hypothetical protein